MKFVGFLMLSLAVGYHSSALANPAHQSTPISNIIGKEAAKKIGELAGIYSGKLKILSSIEQVLNIADDVAGEDGQRLNTALRNAFRKRGQEKSVDELIAAYTQLSPDQTAAIFAKVVENFVEVAISLVKTTNDVTGEVDPEQVAEIINIALRDLDVKKLLAILEEELLKSRKFEMEFSIRDQLTMSRNTTAALHSLTNEEAFQSLLGRDGVVDKLADNSDNILNMLDKLSPLIDKKQIAAKLKEIVIEIHANPNLKRVLDDIALTFGFGGIITNIGDTLLAIDLMLGDEDEVVRMLEEVNNVEWKIKDGLPVKTTSIL